MSATAKGAVAAGHELTVSAASAALKAGGSAFDAAIAGLWMACVCEPVLASPGGGGFLMARDAATGGLTLYDFFVQTPVRKAAADRLDFSGVHADFGTATQEFHIGHGASATPGFVPGLFAVHEDLGSLPMADLLKPATDAALGGFHVTEFQAFLSQVVAPILTASAECRALHAPGGALAAAGETVVNPGLGAFLEGLGDGGMDFYRDAAVDAFIASQDGGGHLGREDFDRFSVIRRAPFMMQLGNAAVALNPPPSAGGAFVACALAACEKLDGPAGFARALGAADRLRIAQSGNGARMLEAAGLAAGAAPDGGAVSRGTTHISVIDGAGNAAAATVSNGSGNGRVVGGWGFMANNMLGEADLNPLGFHLWPENARPASNMCPTLMAGSDDSVCALGSGGSNRIRSSVFQVLLRLGREGASPEAAVHGARAHVENGHLDFEDDFGNGVRPALVQAFPDHRAWTERNLFYGGVHVARRRADGTLEAAGDPRRSGAAHVL